VSFHAEAIANIGGNFQHFHNLSLRESDEQVIPNQRHLLLIRAAISIDVISRLSSNVRFWG
jgi:methylase of polypeptide subunit release factors